MAGRRENIKKKKVPEGEKEGEYEVHMRVGGMFGGINSVTFVRRRRVGGRNNV